MIAETTIDQIRSNLNQGNVREILQYVGYEFDGKKMLKLRLYEKTASASIRRDGYIKDFGSGWGGDVFALLQEYHGLSFPEAVEYVAECLEIEVSYAS